MNKSAFPRIEKRQGNYGEESEVVYPGMTLRDYFAAKALNAAMIADIELAKMGKQTLKDDDSDLANTVYRIADAMLREREK